MDHDNVQVEVQVDHLRAVTYAYLNSTRSLVTRIVVRNVGAENTAGVPLRPRVSIEAPFDDPVCDVWEGAEQELPRPAVVDPPTVVWTRVAPTFNARLLGRLAERANATLLVELLSGPDVVWASRFPITLLAANEWLHDPAFHDALAAFVLPNSTSLRPVLDRARALLEERTGDATTAGYQGEAVSLEYSRDRVYRIAEAVYDALREAGFNYSNPPGDFTGQAQRVRSPQTVFAENAATCLDSTVLYASALAQAGLEPVIFLVEGHAFAGFSVFESVLRQVPPVVDSRAELCRFVEQGLVQPVETTTLCGRGSSRDFVTAMQLDADYFRANVEALEAMVVVRKAWRQGIAPPPTTSDAMLEAVDGEHPAHARQRSPLPPPTLPTAADVDFEYDADPSKAGDRPPPRVRQWMNSLLDLSARNSLLRMQTRQKNGKETTRFMEFVVPPAALGLIDDALFTPRARLVLQTPGDLPAAYKTNGITMAEFAAELPSLRSPLVYPSFDVINELPAEVRAEIARRDAGKAVRNRTDLDIERDLHAGFGDFMDARLRERAGKLKAAADEKLLATGTNTLHLTLGVLTWSEQSASRGGAPTTVQYSAPLYLYPVVLEGGKGSPLAVRLDGSGSITPNYCLQEKLRRPPYNLELPELSMPQADALGIDIDRMLVSIENKLRAAKLDNFAVQRRCVLGVFEYSTFRLWKDLHDNWAQMRDTSAVVRHLMYTPGERMADLDVKPDAAPLEPYCAIEADDSQVEAIQWALEGRSFRLEGPPGTGKTQTITNLIASCLAHGKKILFVAEKQTALQQVKKRLHSIGLGDYCLELHAKGDSDTRLRKNIAEQVGGAAELSADPRDREWQDVAARAKLEERALDAYRAALHDLSPAELSLWKAREGLATIGDGPTVRVPRSFLDEYREVWPRFRDIEFELPNLVQIAGGLADNPWRLVDDLEFEQLDRALLTAAIAELGTAMREFETVGGLWSDVRTATSVEAIELACSAGSLHHRGFAVMEGAFERGVGTSAWSALGASLLAELFAHYAALRPHLPLIGPSVLVRTDLAEVAAAASAAQAAKWPSAGKRLKELQTLVGGPAADADGRAVASAVLEAVPVVGAVRAVLDRIRGELLIVVPEAVMAQPDQVVTRLQFTVATLEGVAGPAADDVVRSAAQRMACAPTGDALGTDIATRFLRAWTGFAALVGAAAAGVERWAGDRSLVDAIRGSLDQWDADRGEQARYLRLQRWCDVACQANKLAGCGLGHLRDDVLAGRIDLQQLGAMVERGVLTAAIEERLESGNIDNFDGQGHDRRIERFERTLAELRALMTERIPGLIVNRRHQQRAGGKQGGRTADLLRELKPLRGEKTPIRTLLEKHGPALVDTMPCFMMSPDSVATLLPVGAITFDLVIFDEASQVKTANAIGALGRGRANIVVGDSKQMPPSSAFSSNHGRFEDDDDDDDDVGEAPESVEGAEEIETAAADVTPLLIGAAARDVESILQEFEAASVPFLQLLCHYRSKDELLIAFSNAEIYERPMLTFPSTEGMTSSALEFRRVDGQFLRKRTLVPDPADPARQIDGIRTNPAEAEAVVEEVLARLRDPRRQARRAAGKRAGDESIIVVTFNKPQQELIRQMLEAMDDPERPVVAPALMEEKDDDTGVLIADAQLKIRNLETVQGDEAETVIFSVAFSKLAADERKVNSSRVPLNFGPVTQEGGHRRLNVAVTRAQRKMIVFCSFDPLDMDVKPTSSEGARLVQKFLLLAKNGPKSTGDIGVGGSRSRHINDIAAAIEARGYRVQTQLGLSSLRVDIAVGLPGREGWDVAVLADGPAWAERGSAYQREILPKNILRSLGWKRVVRVWLPSWIDERAAVLERIMQALDGASSSGADEPPADKHVHEVAVEVPVPSLGEAVARELKPDVAFPPPAFPPPAAPPAPMALPADADLPGAPVDTATTDELDEIDAMPREPLEVPVAESPAGYTGAAPFVPFVPSSMGDAGILDLMSSGNAKRMVQAAIDAVLEAEAPIVADRLGRLVANCFGLGTVRQARIDAILDLVPKNRIEKTSLGQVVWQSAEQRAAWSGYRLSAAEDRPFHEVPLVELMQAVVDTLVESSELDREDAMRVVASMYGIGRLGAKVRERIDAAIATAVKKKLIEDHDGVLRLAVGD